MIRAVLSVEKFVLILFWIVMAAVLDILRCSRLRLKYKVVQI